MKTFTVQESQEFITDKRADEILYFGKNHTLPVIHVFDEDGCLLLVAPDDCAPTDEEIHSGNTLANELDSKIFYFADTFNKEEELLIEIDRETGIKVKFRQEYINLHNKTIIKKLIDVLKFSQEEINCLRETYQAITPCPLIIGETIEEARKYLYEIIADKEEAFNQWWAEEGEMLCGKRNKDQAKDLFNVGYKAALKYK